MKYDILNLSDSIATRYSNYLSTMFQIADKDYSDIFNKKIGTEMTLKNGPYLDVIPSFSAGPFIKNIKDSFLCEKLTDIECYKNFRLYEHQFNAISNIIKNKRSTIVSTGTGSGKTQCFLIPIINFLLEEKTKNGETELSKGVRALIIYPMNALANDQIAQLRELLKGTGITFGSYTGQTEEKYKIALEEYHKLNRKSDGSYLNPIDEELISREQMRAAPPNILITNYSMLEYLLIRPEDNVFFNGDFSNDWKYIVLDEAHIYSGSTGTEVSFLIRRLKAAIHSKNKLQFILTSATLGEKDKDEEVAKFGSNLCDENFIKDDVIRGIPEIIERSCDEVNLGISFYNDVYSMFDLIESGIQSEQRAIMELKSKYKIISDITDSIDHFLYETLKKDKLFWSIKDYFNSPKDINLACSELNLDKKEFYSFVYVANKAIYNKSKLFDSRFHLFLRATDGVFITLSPHKDLFLERSNTITLPGGEEYKVFEAAVCDECHGLYILGKEEEIDGKKYLTQNSSFGDLLLNRAYYINDIAKDDTEDDDNSQDEKKEEFEICPHCGFIRKKGHKDICNHNPNEYVLVTGINAEENENGEVQRIKKCLCCGRKDNTGILRPFFSGQDASTSVIATALFEGIPYTPNKDKTSEAKSCLIFSDNRQSAAYFPFYTSRKYHSLMMGKFICDEIQDLNNDSDYVSIRNFVTRLGKRIKKNKHYKIYETKLKNNDFEKEALKSVLEELANINKNTYLYSLGLFPIDFDEDLKEEILKSFKEKNELLKNEKFFFNEKFLNLGDEELCDLLMIFITQLFSDCCFCYDSINAGKDISEEEKKEFTHNGIEKEVQKHGDIKKNTITFITRDISPNSIKYSKRMKFIEKINNNLVSNGLINQKYDRRDIIEILSIIYEVLERTVDNTNIIDPDENKIDISNFVIYKRKKLYRCTKCNNITTFNVNNLCARYNCIGTLVPISSSDKFFTKNHYFNLYKNLCPDSMIIKEHSAQLSKEEAQKYQNDFIDKKIDFLSCSTTFEMGVDVGDLETVFMRNVPPTPANYIQRAGRAGRNLNVSAFIVTFCNRSNHDFNYFNNPVKMIKGQIITPVINTNNEKIAIRHVYSSALSFFFKEYKNSIMETKYNSFTGETKKTKIEDAYEYYYNGEIRYFFLQNEIDKTTGIYKLKEFLKDNELTKTLKIYLKNVLNENLYLKFDIDNGKWVDWLFDNPNDDYPCIISIYNEYMSDHNQIEEEIHKNIGFNNTLLKERENIESENIISFLSKSNILPKYGFPVDTVPLKLGMLKDNKNNNKFNLSRDLSMAITEYAPGSKIIADGKVITSGYIRRNQKKVWKIYNYYTCSCKTTTVNLNINDRSKLLLTKCLQCGKEINPREIRQMLLPEFGFITKGRIENPTLIKPAKHYSTEATFESKKEDVLQTKKYKLKNVTIIVDSINNGSLIMMNKEEYNVCENCGFAWNNAEYYKLNKLDHKNPWGNLCKSNRSSIKKYSLGYTFKTDVIRIMFNKKFDLTSNDDSVPYSVLQALIIAARMVLNVGDDEISGVLQKYDSNDIHNYGFVIYDNTPGGSGYTKQLTNFDTLKKVIKTAYNIADNCSCGGPTGDSSCYNCLRNYGNQKRHDDIKRKYVLDYLSNIKFEIDKYEIKEDINNAEFWDSLKDNNYNNKTTLSLLKDMLEDYEDNPCREKIKELIEKINNRSVIMPTASHLDIGYQKIEVDLVWKSKKVILIGDWEEGRKIYEFLQSKVENGIYLLDEKFNIDDFIKKISEE